MKKTLLLSLSVAFVLSFTACKKEKKSTTDNTNTGNGSGSNTTLVVAKENKSLVTKSTAT